MYNEIAHYATDIVFAYCSAFILSQNEYISSPILIRLLWSMYWTENYFPSLTICVVPCLPHSQTLIRLKGTTISWKSICGAGFTKRLVSCSAGWWETFTFFPTNFFLLRFFQIFRRNPKLWHGYCLLSAETKLESSGDEQFNVGWINKRLKFKLLLSFLWPFEGRMENKFLSPFLFLKETDKFFALVTITMSDCKVD